MKHLEKFCISCRFYRPKDTEQGICRLDKSLKPDYPVSKHYENCEQWQTCDQQYYIRAGWLKKQQQQVEVI